MTKQDLLKEIYEIVGGKDLLEQDEIYSLNAIVENEIVQEAAQGNMQIKRYPNGYIYDMKTRGEK